jgi:hypothetical protein
MGRTIIPRLEHGSIGAVYFHPDPGRNHAVVRQATKRQISLEALNLIERHPGPLASKNNETTLYSFKGLIAAATPYAKEALEVRAQAAKAKKKRLESKKPKLVVNNPEK